MQFRDWPTLLLLTMILSGTPALGQATVRIIGYYTSWSIYARNYHVPDIPAPQITHINYAFANLQNGRVVLGDTYADVDRFYPGDSWHPDSLRGSFHQLQILKSQFPHLRTLISVGGWTWSGQFSDAALTPQSRQNFAVSCAEFVHRYGFDGVDIDWEYPVSGGLVPGRPEDRHNFTLLLRAIRAQLDSLENAHNREYLLTIAAPAGPQTIANLEVDSIQVILDWMNIMTYDFHGPWGGDADVVTHFNSPLHVAPDDPLPEPLSSQLNFSAAVQAYLDFGVPREKICAGLPFYGRGYGNVSVAHNGLFVPYSGPAPLGTWENGVFDYWDLAANYVNRNGFSRYWHEGAQVPWLFNPAARVMISYDDSASIIRKAQWVTAMGLGGVMFWDFSGDRFHGLLNDLNSALDCGSVADLTVALLPDTAVQLSFTAQRAATYYVWCTRVPNHDGNPDGGNDPQWSLVASLAQPSPGWVMCTDPSALSAYGCYVVTCSCAP